MNTNKKKTTQRVLVGIAIWIVFMLIRLIPAPTESKDISSRSTHINDEITVVVTRELTTQLTEEDLIDPTIVESIENHLLQMAKKKMNGVGREKFYESGGTGEFNPSYSVESWSITVDDRNFVIVRMDVGKIVQSTTFIGIQGDELIKISGFRKGKKLVPHMHGKCVDKVEEIFGVDFIDV